ncbi:MAG: hypothetical protein R3332_08485 [Pseudohongiellaceae bacterium]|nr:hypothetical protein [Pseudohongiellaceae bacterium]
MKVSILGFELTPSKGVDFQSIYDNLIGMSDSEIKIFGRIHVPYVGIANNYIQGLILSYRTSKKSLVSERDANGDLLVKKNELGAGQHGTEVSIFTINPLTGRGVMYSYYGSLSETGYQNFFKRSHNIVRSELKKKQRQKSKDKDELKRLFGETNTYEFKILKTPADLDRLLEQFQDIGSISLAAEDALSVAGRFQPLETYAKNARISVKMDNENHTIKDIKKVIKKVFGHWDKNKPKSFTLAGLAHSGQELTRRLGENSDDFGKINYDDYVEMLPVAKWKDFHSCVAATDMIKILNSNTVIFGQVP